MKESQDYQELRTKLENLSSNWDKHQGLDPAFIEIIMYGNWREKKKVGCKKGYNGWSFFSTSTNSAGYELYQEIQKLISDFKNLRVYERQL
tara:strand:+ start:175 stop:447 length:273 start_codon:yes stop_codon:yes gene_type:complete